MLRETPRSLASRRLDGSARPLARRPVAIRLRSWLVSCATSPSSSARVQLDQAGDHAFRNWHLIPFTIWHFFRCQIGCISQTALLQGFFDELPLSPRTAIGLFLIVVLAWGVNWSVTKQLVQFLPPLWTSAIRSWIALAALFVILGPSNNLMIPERRDIPVVLSVALLHMTIFSVLVAAGVRFLPASKAIVLGYTTPLWVAIAAPLLGKDTLTAPKLAGALLGLIGLAVILNPTSIDWTNADVVLGAGMVILAAISWAANIIYIRAHRWIASPAPAAVLAGARGDDRADADRR